MDSKQCQEISAKANNNSNKKSICKAPYLRAGA